MAQPMLLEGHSPDDTRSHDRDLMREIQTLRSRVAELQDKYSSLGREYASVRAKNDALTMSLLSLRTVLLPLHTALRGVFGELDAIAPEAAAPSAAPDARKSAVWEAWKKRLGGLAAQTIDALLLHGELSRAQLRITLGCSTRAIPDIIYKLNKAGLITKNGSKIALTEL